MSLLRHLLLVSIGIGASTMAHGQATVKPDGQWRAAIGAGASVASGNTQASSISINADAVRASAADKLSLYGGALRARTNGETSADQARAGGRYDYNLNTAVFGFGGLDFERNKLSNLKLRSQLGGGLGYHVIKTELNTWDIFGGLTYTHDRFVNEAVFDGDVRSSYSYPSLLLGEESLHKLSDTTTAKQRFVMYPNLRNTGQYRASWDAGISVAMTKRLNLTAGVALRYDSQPGDGIKKTDSLFTTGISMKFD